ncbi:hypothetical protein [Streptomyces sp. NPDC001787]|uniref:hypothetical protein n=1 Tax=Streptomyces sp. NPDC001787 TaxID=3154523 RepID=UPI00331F1019
MPLRRRAQYLLYQLGIRRTIHGFGDRKHPSDITFLIPDSLGDIAVNASVTRHFRALFPDARMTLITHPKYLAAAEFNPDYSAALAYDAELCPLTPGEQSYRDEIRIARALTPNMDVLFLCQPSAWCDALSARHTMLELQNRLCGVEEGVRLMPRLTLPSQAARRAKTFRAAHGGPAVFMTRQTFSFRLGPWHQEYCRDVAQWCVDRGVRVFDNSPEPVIRHRLCSAVGDLPLADAVAVATMSDASVSVRSGFVDLVGFSRPELPQYVLYPDGNYRFSHLSWWEWCSVADMGVTGAAEASSPFRTGEEATAAATRTQEWLEGVLDGR